MMVLQAEDAGQSLTLSITNGKGDRSQVVWSLSKSEINEGQWSVGRVELNPEKVFPSDTQDYRVLHKSIARLGTT